MRSTSATLLRFAPVLLLLAGTGCSSLGAGSSSYFDRLWRRIKGISLEQALAEANSDLPDTRREAILVLAQHKATRGSPALHRNLAEAAFGGTRDDGRFYEPDPDISVRVAALAALRINEVQLSPDQLRLLRGCLDFMADDVVDARRFNRHTAPLRTEACECLANWPHDEATDRLVAAVRNDPDSDVRLAAARCLGKARPADRERRAAVAAVLIEHVSLRDGKPFALKYESLQTLEELTGKPDFRYDPDAWRGFFAEHPDDAFAQAGVLPVRVPIRQTFWQKTGNTLDRLLYIIRKPERTEE